MAAAILVESGRPLIFRQERVGLWQQPFTVLKFRTMPQGTPQVAKDLLANHIDRIRPLGRLLRRFSLDELPQFVNVLQGDMSLVGPRPALPSQTELVEMREAAGVHAVRPGITGLSQISGRESLSLGDKVGLDADYVRRVGPGLDLLILVKTAFVLFSSKGTF